MIFSRITLLNSSTPRLVCKQLALLWILSISVIQPLHAEENTVVVPAPPETGTDTGLEPANLCIPTPADTNIIPQKPSDNKIHLQADSANLSEKDITTFNGDVVIEQNDLRLSSDQAIYNKTEQDINATGNAKLTKGSLNLTGDSIQMNLNTNLGSVQNATYHDTKSRAQGQAKNIAIKSKTELEMNKATYTTCNGPAPDWELSATTLNLNNETHQGSANNVVIRFKSVPFLYLPYLLATAGHIWLIEWLLC